MANEFDMTCPECGRDDELDVQVSTWARVTESGTDETESHDGSHEWDNSTPCYCAACQWSGVAGDASPDATPISATEPAAPIAAIVGAVSRSRMASSIGKASPKEKAAKESGVRLVAIDIAATIGAQIPDFDRAAFLTACGFHY